MDFYDKNLSILDFYDQNLSILDSKGNFFGLS